MVTTILRALYLSDPACSGPFVQLNIYDAFYTIIYFWNIKKMSSMLQPLVYMLRSHKGKYL
jgi:hypothetical protein